MFEKLKIDSENTGRFYVKSTVTGKVYLVEPMGKTRTDWGDINPATKKVEGTYGKKYRGSIDEDDSLITEDNGFDNIVMTGIGESPFSYIEELDMRYLKEMKEENDGL